MSDHDAQPVRDDRTGQWFWECTCGRQGEVTTEGLADIEALAHMEATS